jgi:AraC-like DNA-binding protein
MVGRGLDIPADYYLITLVRRGALRLVEASGERTLLPRCFLLASPGADRRLVPGPGAEEARLGFGRSALDPESLGGEAADLLGLRGGSGAPIRIARLPPPAFEEAWAIRARIADELGDESPGAETIRRLRLAQLLMLLYRYGNPSPRPEERRPAFRAEEAVAYIKERYAEDLSLASLAESFGLNPSYLSRAFAHSAGIHLMEYINRVRIEKSCVLLKRSSLSVIDIAFAVGYKNLSHFNRYFRRVVRMSPSEYRRQSEK